MLPTRELASEAIKGVCDALTKKFLTHFLDEDDLMQQVGEPSESLAPESFLILLNIIKEKGFYQKEGVDFDL